MTSETPQHLCPGCGQVDAGTTSCSCCGQPPLLWNACPHAPQDLTGVTMPDDDDPDPWAGLTNEQLRMLSTTRRQTVNLEQTVRLLEDRLEEKNRETRHWMELSKRHLRVVSIARQAVAWWPSACDHYPSLSAPWVGSMNLALADLDKDERLRAELAARLEAANDTEG